MKTKGKIYIVGSKKAGDSIEKFKEAQSLLDKQGFQAINPLDEKDIDQTMKEIATCTAIYVLPCALEDNLCKSVINHALSENYDIYYELENVEAHGTADSLQG